MVYLPGSDTLLRWLAYHFEPPGHMAGDGSRPPEVDRHIVFGIPPWRCACGIAFEAEDTVMVKAIEGNVSTIMVAENRGLIA